MSLGSRGQERPGDLISATLRLYREVMGVEPQLVDDFAPVLQSLLEGATDIIVELPWVEVHSGELVARHQVVLQALIDDNTRVTFYNPAARHEAERGSALGGGERDGPPRRSESAGLESMELSLLARYFADGRASALIPPVA